MTPGDPLRCLVLSTSTPHKRWLRIVNNHLVTVLVTSIRNETKLRRERKGGKETRECFGHPRTGRLLTQSRRAKEKRKVQMSIRGTCLKTSRRLDLRDRGQSED